MTGYHDKYADQSVRDRLLEDSIARLRGALFTAAIGPLAIGAFYFMKYQPPAWMKVAVVATAPLAFLLLMISYFRIPGAGKTTGRAVRILLLTLALAIATPILGSALKIL